VRKHHSKQQNAVDAYKARRTSPAGVDRKRRLVHQNLVRKTSTGSSGSGLGGLRAGVTRTRPSRGARECRPARKCLSQNVVGEGCVLCRWHHACVTVRARRMTLARDMPTRLRRRGFAAPDGAAMQWGIGETLDWEEPDQLAAVKEEAVRSRRVALLGRGSPPPLRSSAPMRRDPCSRGGASSTDAPPPESHRVASEPGFGPACASNSDLPTGGPRPASELQASQWVLLPFVPRRARSRDRADDCRRACDGTRAENPRTGPMRSTSVDAACGLCKNARPSCRRGGRSMRSTRVHEEIAQRFSRRCATCPDATFVHGAGVMRTSQ